MARSAVTARRATTAMLLQLLVIVGGFAVLTWSADRFVFGAAGTARVLGVPTLVIGLTVVGFGTSAPEMLISGIAAWEGKAGIALGNAVGSNIANVGLIAGVTALLYPLSVHSGVLRRELPLMVLVLALTFVVLIDRELWRVEGATLLAALVLLLVWLGIQGRRGGAVADVMGTEFEEEIPRDASLGASLFWLVAGLALLLISSRALVWAAVEIAVALGVSDLVIGLTIVALGTSLPELATCVASARKGEHDIALGNVIGSNMFNMLGVLGLAGLIAPFRADAESMSRDFPVMTVLTLGLFLMAYRRGGMGRINRLQGALLLACYLGYQGYVGYAQL